MDKKSEEMLDLLTKALNTLNARARLNSHVGRYFINDKDFENVALNVAKAIDHLLQERLKKPELVPLTAPPPSWLKNGWIQAFKRMYAMDEGAVKSFEDEHHINPRYVKHVYEMCGTVHIVVDLQPTEVTLYVQNARLGDVVAHCRPDLLRSREDE